MPTTSVICIGDPHFKVENVLEVKQFMEKILVVLEYKKPSFIVILGDILHTHEKIHTDAMNMAYKFINAINKISKTYILVGNHDMISNQIFLTPDHWMNGMKEWKNTIIVDKVIKEEINGNLFVFVPYVYAGRFQEALYSLNDDDKEYYKKAKCIFAHQEFYGCKMGAIVSIDGDKWDLDNPNIISGHIHNNQKPQENIYYPGSSIETSFGESQNNIIAFLEFKDENKNYFLEEIDLKLPRKKIVYLDVDSVENFTLPITEDKLKVSISGEFEDFKVLKKTKKYKELVDNGVKVVFKPKRSEKKLKNEKMQENIEKNEGVSDFKLILEDMIENQKNPYLREAYELIINNKQIDSSSIIYM
jgi:DNA repair exonuclease SbcCD nuclease subunit